MKYLKIIVCTALFFALSGLYGQVSAAEQAKNLKMVVLPVTAIGDLGTSTAQEIRLEYEKSFEQKACHTNLVFLSEDDPAIKGINDIHSLSKKEAMQLAKATGADFIAWGKINITKNEKSIESAGIIYNLMTIITTGEIFVFETEKNEIINEKPSIRSYSDRNRAMNASQAYKSFQKSLVIECIHGLAEDLYEAIRDSLDCAADNKTETQTGR